MGDPTPPTVLDLSWERELRFTAQAGDVQFTVDGSHVAGPSPMQALAAALAGCMAIDLVHILTKGRQPPAALRARFTGHRAATEPRRYERIDLHFTIQGDVPPGAVERGIALSREKYCSVWHSLRQDIDLQITYDIIDEGGRAAAR
jgi:putative redox protein